MAAPLLAHLAAPVGWILPHAIRPLVPHARVMRAFARIAPRADRAILLDPAFGAVLVGDIVHAMDGGLAAPLHDLRLFGRDRGPPARRCRVPVCFFQGDADGFVPAAHGHHQASRVQRGVLTILAGGGHLAGYVDAGRMFDALAPYLGGATIDTRRTCNSKFAPSGGGIPSRTPRCRRWPDGTPACTRPLAAGTPAAGSPRRPGSTPRTRVTSVNA